MSLYSQGVSRRLNTSEIQLSGPVQATITYLDARRLALSYYVENPSRGLALSERDNPMSGRWLYRTTFLNAETGSSIDSRSWWSSGPPSTTLGLNGGPFLIASAEILKVFDAKGEQQWQLRLPKSSFCCSVLTWASRKNIYVRSLDKVVPQSSGLLESYDAQSGQPGPSLPIPSVWRDLWVADDSVVYALRSGSTVRYVLAPLTGRVQNLWVDQQGGRLINVLSADRFLVAPTDHTIAIVNRRGEILVQR